MDTIEENLKSKAVVAHFVLGDAHLNKGNYTQAIEDYSKIIELNPHLAEAYFGRGQAYFSNGNYTQAIKDYSKTIELNPYLLRAYVSRGIAHSNEGNNIEAIKDCNIAVQLGKNNTMAYAARGLASANFGNNVQAIKDCNIAIVLDRDNEMAYIARGLAHENLGNNAQAVKDYDKAIGLGLRCAEVYYRKGRSLEKLGNYKDSITNYERVLDIKPSHYKAATRRNTIILKMPANGKEEYKNEELKEFDKLLYYGFATTFSKIDKSDIEQKILNNHMPNDDIEAARQRIDKTMSDFHDKTDYETRIAKCKLEEFPIVLTIYYYITKKILPDTAYTLLLYFAKKMADERDDKRLKKIDDVMREIIKAIGVKLYFVFAIIDFLQSLQNVFTAEIWKGKSEYKRFKKHLPIFLREERKKMGDKKLSSKYCYFENNLKEYRRIFE